MTEKLKSFFSLNTLVPFSVIIPLLAFSFWLGVRITQIDSKLDSISSFIRYDSWSYVEERQSWADYRFNNPKSVVPDVQQIHRDHVQ
jgi:hypothetical protein